MSDHATSLSRETQRPDGVDASGDQQRCRPQARLSVGAVVASEQIKWSVREQRAKARTSDLLAASDERAPPMDQTCPEYWEWFGRFSGHLLALLMWHGGRHHCPHVRAKRKQAMQLTNEDTIKTIPEELASELGRWLELAQTGQIAHVEREILERVQSERVAFNLSVMEVERRISE